MPDDIASDNLQPNQPEPNQPEPSQLDLDQLKADEFLSCDLESGAVTSIASISRELVESLPLYEAVRDQIKVGDVIAFSGQDVGSRVVKLATRSDYAHVGIVCAVNLAGGSGDTVLLAESHIDTSLPSVGTGRRIIGVQLQWLAERLSVCHGQVWWVPLRQPLPPETARQMQHWLTAIEAEQVPYDWKQAIGAGLGSFDLGALELGSLELASLEKLQVDNRPDFSALFCSELVSRALQLAGAIDLDLNASEQTPADVMDFACLKEPVLIKKTADNE